MIFSLVILVVLSRYKIKFLYFYKTGNALPQRIIPKKVLIQTRTRTFVYISFSIEIILHEKTVINILLYSFLTFHTNSLWTTALKAVILRNIFNPMRTFFWSSFLCLNIN